METSYEVQCLWGLWMLLRTITLKFNPVTEQFDEDELQEFIKDKEILSVREHFFIKHETPYLVIFITYLPGDRDIAPDKKQKDSWKDLLSDDQLPLFDALRDWRAERAKQEGVPPYIICNNRQLAQIVATRPTTLAGLAKVHGIGKAKIEKYGKELLALLKPEAPKDEPTKQQKTLFAEERSSQDKFSQKTSPPTEQKTSIENDNTP
jgi:ATP-dependent DNA helicase RecQ